MMWILCKFQKILDIFQKQGMLSDSIKITILKLNELQSKLNSIKPFKRPKRGLIDVLGTAVKFITGIMDGHN